MDSAPPPKKPKKEDESIMKKQNKEIFKYRDNLKTLTKNELNMMLAQNIPNFVDEGYGQKKVRFICVASLIIQDIDKYIFS